MKDKKTTHLLRSTVIAAFILMVSISAFAQHKPHKEKEYAGYLLPISPVTEPEQNPFASASVQMDIRIGH